MIPTLLVERGTAISPESRSQGQKNRKFVGRTLTPLYKTRWRTISFRAKMKILLPRCLPGQSFLGVEQLDNR